MKIPNYKRTIYLTTALSFAIIGTGGIVGAQEPAKPVDGAAAPSLSYPAPTPPSTETRLPGSSKTPTESPASVTAPPDSSGPAAPAPTASSEPSSTNTTNTTTVSAAPNPAIENRPVTDKWALIIGIGKFEQPSVPSLRYAAKDAQDFRDFLVEKANFKPDHVRLLLNEKATRKQILSGFDKFLGRVARKDDLVVVYFSTHGSPDTCDSRGRSYLISYDTDKEDLYASSIPMSDITDLVRERINSDRVLLVMDTCFSGATTSGGSKAVDEVGNMDAAKIAQGSGQLVICSSSPKEKSWESRRYPNGIFTRKLMDALTLNGAQTKLGDAFASIRDEVENEVREDHGIKQRPVLATASWRGADLLLAAPPAAPRPLPDAVRQLLERDSAGQHGVALDRSITNAKPVESRPAEPPKTTARPLPTAQTKKKVEPAKNPKKPVLKVVKPQEQDAPSKAPPPVAPLWGSPDR